ncbi:unnamed protein product, partial [Porites lobata]
MGVQFSGSENEDLNQNDSDDQDSSSLSKGSNSTSSADEDETSEEKGDFFSNASRNSHHTYKEGSSESKSEHWTLLAVLPKEKSVVVLDSMPSNHIKHTSLDAISKMCGLLKEINSNVDLNQCKLIVNKKGDVPEQTNDYDC